MSAFTNRMGQTLSPGDRVVVIAQGYNHAIKEYAGTYVGVSRSGSPQVRVMTSIRLWRCPDGTLTSYARSGGGEYVKLDVERVRTYHSARVYRLG